ncbi:MULTISPECIES: hypothetical protein [Oscillatoriales]|uniref:hypothetical protein n=1 Tax=Oscillatoriophycideae TaxID=1301283 RepID=UPI0016884727|nr:MULTISPECIES: hypothetical protein [Oscillatoriales]
MKALLMSSMRSPPQLTTVGRQPTISTTIGQSTLARYTCLCCSDVLLRHIRLGGIYWRCSSCYQEMPV